jgi:hypothetical protein
MPVMPHTRTLRTVAVLVGALVVATLAVPAAMAGSSARRPSVEILGFRAGGSRMIEPGGTIARACEPRRLVAYAAFRNVRRGVLVRRRWRVNGELAKATSVVWDRGRRRAVVRLQIFNPETLPNGRYQIAVRAAGARWAVGSVKLTC